MEQNARSEFENPDDDKIRQEQEANQAGWGSLMSDLGFTGLGDIGHNLGYVIAMMPDILVGMPKVLPKTKFFAINHNRMHGTLPDWLLYHPMLDWWAPTVLVFPQEGVTTYNVRAGFDNEPVNLDYYYDKYVNKKLNPSKKK